MGVSKVSLQQRSPYEKGKAFGDYDEFEIQEFELQYAVDPKLKKNAHIVDISKAPTDINGNVTFSGKARLIAPKHVAPACLLVDVPNRGRPTVFSFNRPSINELQHTSAPAGDGFLFRQGFAVLSVAWQFDAEGFNLTVPNAAEGIEQIRGEAICQMQPNRDTQSLMVGQGGVFTYEPTGQGKLYQRSNTNLPFSEIPQVDWQFGRAQEGDIQPTRRFISKRNGFEKGVVYTLVYETERAAVVGLGLLAIRDATTWCKHDLAWPNGSPPLAIGYGASQTGRFLRHFLYENLNMNEENRTVFDGVLPHIAGGQRGDFNHRFAQPGSMGVPAAGQRFPFSLRHTKDELSGLADGLITDTVSPPKVISTNTSWEYWRGDASLIHVSTCGTQDIEPLPNERIYMFAGTHHINGVLPFSKKFALTGESLPYHLNTISYTPLLRAALSNLLAWLRDGVEPPESRYPNLADGSLVNRQDVLDKFANSAHFPHVPIAENLPSLWLTELGSSIDEGICEHPARLLRRYPSLVSDVDDSFNETAGVRLPEISVPIGTHTGWNPRLADHGAPDQTATFAGFSKFDVPDTLPVNTDACLERVATITDELIAENYVLKEDRQWVIENALTRFAISTS